MYTIKYFSIFTFLIFLSCTIPSPEIVEFDVYPNSINEDEEITIKYFAQNADEVTIYFDSDQKELIYNSNLNNSLINYIPKKDGDVIIEIKGKNEVKTQAKSIKIIKKEIVKINPPSELKIQENQTNSQYLKGLVPFDKLGERNINYEIFGYDRSGFPDSIKLFITIKDDYGNFVANLATPYGNDETEKKYFKKLFETVQGSKTEISNFDVEERHDEVGEPYTFSLVLDHSGSMEFENAINQLQEAAISFIKFKENDDKVQVIKYDDKIELEVPLTNNKQTALQHYKSDGLKRYGKSTAMYAATDVSVNSLEGEKNKVVILFTDGLDNSSLFVSSLNNFTYAFTPKELVYSARKNNAKIYTIGYGNANKKELQKISILTDGKSFYANNGNEINEIINSLPRLFHNYYVVTYKPQNKKGWRDINLICSQLNGNQVNVTGGTHIGDDYDFGEEEPITTEIAYFNYNDASLNENHEKQIELLITFLKKYSTKDIEIHGHTDGQGNNSYNKKLSLSRANKVKNILLKNGISKNRIKVFGHGFENPIYPIETFEWQKANNRRVSVIIKEPTN